MENSLMSLTKHRALSLLSSLSRIPFLTSISVTETSHLLLCSLLNWVVSTALLHRFFSNVCSMSAHFCRKAFFVDRSCEKRKFIWNINIMLMLQYSDPWFEKYGAGPRIHCKSIGYNIRNQWYVLNQSIDRRAVLSEVEKLTLI